MAATKKIQDAVPDDDLKYETWATIMKATLTEVGLWGVVENGVPPDPSKIPELAATIQPPELSKWRNLAIKDMKALKIIQSSLPDSTFRKTLSASSSAKELWDLLKKSNEEARLEKDFEAVRMNEGETLDSYLDRVMDIVEQFPDSKSDYEVITKVLGSLSVSYECVASLLKERFNLKKTSLIDFLELLYGFRSLPGRTIGLMMKESFDSQSKPRKGGVVAEYECLAITVGDFRYDEDMWMIYTGTTNHMTPYLKFFTTLDRTHRARVRLADGSFIMAEGRGDVKIMTEEGREKTIKNVLFVPEINRNVLSVPQFTSIGYSGNNGVCKFTIKDPTRKLFGEATAEERGFFLRFQVIQ